MYRSDIHSAAEHTSATNLYFPGLIGWPVPLVERTANPIMAMIGSLTVIIVGKIVSPAYDSANVHPDCTGFRLDGVRNNGVAAEDLCTMSSTSRCQDASDWNREAIAELAIAAVLPGDDRSVVNNGDWCCPISTTPGARIISFLPGRSTYAPALTPGEQSA